LIVRATLFALLLPAGSALAEVHLVAFDFPAESLAIPQGEPVLAEATLDMTGQVAIHARLGDPAAKDFALITERQVGQMITVSLCGEKLMEAMLQTPLYSGSFMLVGPPAANATDQIIARLNAGRCDALPAP
jgi:preprotein translocase subunit SecD